MGKVNDAFINPVIALIFTAALLIFSWGVFEMIWNGSSDEARSTGRRHMLWGIIGMAVMVSVFALLKIGLATFGIGPTDLPSDLPLY